MGAELLHPREAARRVDDIRTRHFRPRQGQGRGACGDDDASVDHDRAQRVGRLHRAGQDRISDRARWPEVQPSSIRFLELGWSKIDAHIGAQKLSAVRRSDVQALVDRLGKEGASPYVLRNAMAPLRILYRRALVRDQVAINPTLGVELPSVARQKRVHVVSPEDAAALILAIRDTDRATWATAFYAGLRRGELQALRWKHVDLQAKTIQVRRSYDTGGKVEQIPKSKAAVRDLPIITPLLLLLEEHREIVPHGVNDLVFGDQPQVHLSPPPFGNRAKTDWKTAKLKGVSLHEARHTFASFLIAAGVNAKALSVLVGHADIQTTFNVYGHLMPGGAEEAGKRLEGWLKEHQP